MTTAKEIQGRLQDTGEQKLVVGPLVELLVTKGWDLEQIVFGKGEWRVPKSPSESTKREKGQSYHGFPVDIAVFDAVSTVGDPQHLLFIVECKQPTELAGVSQLESYFVGEPHAVLGAWVNNAGPSASAVFLYRRPNGSMLLKRQTVANLPCPGESISHEAQAVTFEDLVQPTEGIFRKAVEDLLDRVVIGDSAVTRREEQLDQLCNLFLLKLESDKQAKASPDEPVFFRPLASVVATAENARRRFSTFVKLYPETFTTPQDRVLRFSDDTIAACVDILSGLRLIDLAVTTVAVAFQVLRSEALKQGEGQYFTPTPVIQAGVRLLDMKLDDLVIDPACGTGGFLVETMLYMGSRFSGMTQADLTRWAQTHLFGIEKDAIGLKLAKAIMQIAGDGSAHCARGDSIRTVKWSSDFPHLASGTFANGRFTVVVTNPPFGKNLKITAKDARLSSLDIAKAGRENYRDLEIGLMFLQRAYDLLADNGRIGIVLPETYFFSPNYLFLQDWLRTRLRPVAVANIPMEAFQGFCRAKTNFYVFQKVPQGAVVGDSEMVTFLNPRTCGIYKNGSVRYVTDPVTGKRTDQVDNELIEAVTDYAQGHDTYGLTRVPLSDVRSRRVIVPTYYDRRYDAGMDALLADEGVSGITIGELVAKRILSIRGGHGSPGNDQRSGHIPYVKVSDIRALRVNVNPTNLVSLPIARKYWRGDTSGLRAWDLITPNRASSNIGEFAVLLPGEEQVVLTKEMFVIRVAEHPILDPFFMLWAFSLHAVREQWRRIALMQTNREDCGKRHLEVVIPMPPSREWAVERCASFENYFTTVASAREKFRSRVTDDKYGYIANVCADEICEGDSEETG